MGAEYIISGGIFVLLLIYLLYVLVNAQRF